MGYRFNKKRALLFTISAIFSVAGVVVFLPDRSSEGNYEVQVRKKESPEETLEQNPASVVEEALPPNPFILSEDQVDRVRRVQAERLALLASECSKEPKPNRAVYERSFAILARRFEIVDKYRVSNCMVLKAGFTAWNALLAYVLGRQDLIDGHQTYMMSRILKGSAAKFASVNSSPDYMKFVVAREPLARLLSAYRDRIDAAHETGAANRFSPLTRAPPSRYKPTHANGTRIMPSFEEFLRYIVSVAPEAHDPHWRPIALQCGACFVNYTLIAHAETLNEDLGYILRETGIEKDADYTILLYNSHKGRGNTSDLLENYYSAVSPKLMQNILAVYRKDFTMFGYDPSDFLKKLYPDGSVAWNP
ncbi:putative carbohydrate sulfotransferase 14-like isoform X3 [Penaeus vannamei]|uniref:Carbohydrate sulfotransferase n=1 Tax=Penaeus vannamei TaxID=6689 RepID=A0A423SZE2_PENVA|nr:putative carbohydrate sulfotransferase 14-like isoform X3 [Penaeus vannamei]